MPTYIPTPANEIQNWSAAVFGQAIGFTTLNQVLAAQNATPGGAPAYVEYVALQTFGNQSNAQVATTIANNICSVTGWTGSDKVAITDWIFSVLNSAPTSQRGAAISFVMDICVSSAAQENEYWGAGATLWANAIIAAGTYAETPGNNAAYDIATGLPAEAWTLTSGTDIYIATQADNDFFAGYNLSGDQTLNSTDSLVGGSGANTLVAALKENVRPIQLTNIQDIELTSTSSANLDLIYANAVQNIAFVAPLADIGVSNVRSANVNYTIAEVTDQVVSIDVLNSAFPVGEDSAANIEIIDSEVKLNLDAGYSSANIALDTDIYASNEIKTEFAGNLVLSGTGNLILSGSSDSTISSTSIDSIAFAGNLDITGLTNNDITFAGGNGDTTINAAGVTTASIDFDFGNGTNILQVAALSTVSNAVSVSGGAGVDTLQLTAQLVTGVDDNFATMSGFDILALNNVNTNSITIGTNFVNVAGFSEIAGSASNDSVTASNVVLDDLLFVGNGGTDTFTFNNTASGSIIIDNVDIVNVGANTGVANQTVDIRNGGTVSVALGAGTGDVVNILDNGISSVTVTGVETINTYASITGNTVILGDNTTVVTINGGEGNLTVNAVAATSAANTYDFGDGTNTLQVASLSTVSNAATVSGGAGVDTLELTAQLVGGVDGSYAPMSGFDILALNNAGTNSLSIGTNFIDAGFSEITGSASNDSVTALGGVYDDLLFVGGGGTDTFTFNNTASGSIIVDNVDLVTVGAATGVANQTVDILNGGTVSVALGAGTGDVVNILDNGISSVTVTGVETINTYASITGNTVILGDNTTVVTINGGEGNLTVNAVAATSAANTYDFGDGTNTLQVASLSTVSNAATVSGGAGVDTLELTAQLVGGVDGSYAPMSGFDILALNNAGTNSLSIGTNFIDAGFSEITGSASNDSVTALGGVYDDLLFVGGGGTDTFTFNNTASGSISVENVEAIAAGADTGVANQTVTIVGDDAVTMTVNLGAGASDSVVNTNTNDVTITVTAVESYLGSAGVDTIRLGSAGAITVNGGGGTDSVSLQVNTSGLTAIAGEDAAMTITGNVGTFTDTVAINGAGTYSLTNVETVSLGADADGAVINSWLFSNAVTGVTGNGSIALSTYTLADDNSATFAFANVTSGLTGGAVYLTVDASDSLNANITFDGNTLKATQTAATVVSTNDLSYTTITLDVGGTNTSSDVIQTNLGNLSAGTSTADSIFVTNFGNGDSIDLIGYTLVDADGGETILRQSYVDATGLTLGNEFVAGQTFITGNSTTLANFTSGPNDEGIIFQFAMEGSTANFATQAGIDAAVSYIVTNIGTTTSGSQSAVLAIDSGSGSDAYSALFLFQDDGGSGIDASELQLIGVVSGNLANASAFS